MVNVKELLPGIVSVWKESSERGNARACWSCPASSMEVHGLSVANSFFLVWQDNLLTSRRRVSYGFSPSAGCRKLVVYRWLVSVPMDHGLLVMGSWVSLGGFRFWRTVEPWRFDQGSRDVQKTRNGWLVIFRSFEFRLATPLKSPKHGSPSLSI